MFRRALLIVCFIAAGSTTGAAQTPHPSFDVAVTGTGRPILLIPGLKCTGEVWASTIDRYKDRHTLHVVTLAGFGGPAPIGGPFLPRVRDELIRYVREQRLDKPVIVGHSLGGFLAFWIAGTAPDLVGGVVAVDGVPFLPALSNPTATPETSRPQADQIRSMYASLTPEQMTAQGRMALTTMITAPSDVERAVAWVKRSDASATGIAVAELLTTDLRKNVAAITAPTLLIGALGAAPPAMHPAFRAAYEAQVTTIRGARVIMAEKARHFIMLDDPTFFFAALDAFLGTR